MRQTRLSSVEPSKKGFLIFAETLETRQGAKKRVLMPVTEMGTEVVITGAAIVMETGRRKRKCKSALTLSYYSAMLAKDLIYPAKHLDHLSL
jgi:hypothetical protein